MERKKNDPKKTSGKSKPNPADTRKGFMALAAMAGRPKHKGKKKD